MSRRQKISRRPLPKRKLPPECLCCGQANPWIPNKVDFTTPFRDTEHKFRAEVNQCRHCDAISTTPEQVEKISAEVREAHRVWISKKFKTACKELGVSIRELVTLTGIPHATLARASSGERLIEATVEKLLWKEIKVLRDKRLMSALINMRTEPANFGVISIKMESIASTCEGLYATALKTAAQSPLSRTADSLPGYQSGELSEELIPSYV